MGNAAVIAVLLSLSAGGAAKQGLTQGSRRKAELRRDVCLFGEINMGWCDIDPR